jgi:hypothetical protein
LRLLRYGELELPAGDVKGEVSQVLRGDELIAAVELVFGGSVLGRGREEA